MSYLEEFTTACLTTQNLGIAPPKPNWEDCHIKHFASLRAYPNFTQRLEAHLRSEGATSLVFNCARISVAAGPHLSKEFTYGNIKTDAWVTIGWVEENGVKHCVFTSEDAVKLVNDVEEKKRIKKTGKIPFHVWLTLSTGEIFDATFLSSLANVNPFSGSMNEPICGDPYVISGLKKLTFHPIVVGEDYFKMIGIPL